MFRKQSPDKTQAETPVSCPVFFMEVETMDLLTGNIRTLYFKFLSAAFGSALISCIYGMVDMAMVGQYQGPDGAAALAVVAPVWNIIYSLGLLTGIGGSVLFSARRGGGHAQGEDNQYFTAAVVGSGILAVLSWAWILLFEREVLLFFGADETLLPLAQAYLAPVRCVFPVFLLGQLVSSFLRNDARPGLATAAVLTGGIFNVFGDWFRAKLRDLALIDDDHALSIGNRHNGAVGDDVLRTFVVGASAGNAVQPPDCHHVLRNCLTVKILFPLVCHHAACGAQCCLDQSHFMCSFFKVFAFFCLARARKQADGRGGYWKDAAALGFVPRAEKSSEYHYSR